MKNIKRNIITAAVAVLMCTAVIFASSPNVKFYIQTAISSYFGKSDLKKVEKSKIQLVEKSIKHLMNDPVFIFDQSLLLVNSDTPLPDDFKADLSQYENTQAFINSCAIDAFIDMRNKLQDKFGDRLMIMSSYRSREEQEQVLSEEGGKTAATPGKSEHETGLAVDVYIKYYAGKGFIKSEIGKHVNLNCGDYGFIIRYPLGRKNITGFNYEPWHLRYVGMPHSEIISDSGITLEEYLNEIEIDCFYEYENFIISKQDGDSLLIPENCVKAVISPDNCGNHIITCEISK